MHRDEEAALVQRVAAGDRVAFRTLVEAHQRALSSFVRRMLLDQDSASDIVQETFLRLWTRAGSYNADAARLSTWLHNIARNLCVDSFRKKSRSLEGVGSVACENDQDPISIDPGPAEQRGAQEQAARVRAAIAGLSERQRSAVLMCHYQGLSNRDAAQILDVSVEALESLLSRARRRLKQELIEHDYS
ncbi:MAG: sigma-70 family RNA polymerase sigma factor [Congregibacter sp.]